MECRQHEYGEAFRDVLGKPGKKFRGGFFIYDNDAVEKTVGVLTIFGIENGSQFLGQYRAHTDFWNELPGILLQMKLTSLPRDAWETGLNGGPETGVAIADDQTEAEQSSLLS